MTTQETNDLIDRYLEGWMGSGCTPGFTLRERIAAMIAEAEAGRDKLWRDGAETLKHDLNSARYTARHARQSFDDLHIQIDEYGVTGNSDGSIQSKINAVCQERDALARWKAEQLAVESRWAKVDEFVRASPDCVLGEKVADRALTMLRERDEAIKAAHLAVEEGAKDKARLDMLEHSRFDLAECDGGWYLSGSDDPKIQAVSFPTVRAALDNAL